MGIMKRLLLCFLVFLAGCSSSQPKEGRYSIARDPYWFPLNLEQMTLNINGFTNALVLELAEVEKKNFHLIDTDWSQLYEGLEQNAYAAVFTSLPQNVISEEKYAFSDPFLLLGPVLVVPKDSPVDSLADLEGETVSVYRFDDSVLVAQRYPSILISLYESVTGAFEEVASGNVAGALVPNLQARTLIPALYKDKLKIVTAPLTNKGLKVITLKGKHPSLLKHFNAGLKKMQDEGSYDMLLNKFGVIPEQ
ncbi:MAG: hypothetical protein S4CHLAM2_03760 [Chlamydiales bacterium]|nr:hypothetical protein [Chlamydiales bacterium]